MNTPTTEHNEIMPAAFVDQPFVLHKFEKPGEIALYYGFIPIQSPALHPKDRQPARSVSPTNTASLRNRPSKTSRKEYELGLRPEEKCALFRTYVDEKLTQLAHPIGVYYTLPLTGDTRTKIRGNQHALDIIGSRQPISDATILKTALEMLSEEGHAHVYISLNSIGDEPSKNRFRRELMDYFRAHADELPKKAQSLINENVFALMNYDDETINALKAGAPNPMDYLDEESRQRFMDVLEFLETLDIPYRIDTSLVGDMFYEHTVFEIRRTPSHSDEKGELLGRGGCYTGIACQYGYDDDVPGVGITLCYNRTTRQPRTTFELTRVDRPQCYFMQLGPLAKLKSLHIIENLRRVRVLMRHTLGKEKCHGQMSCAQQIELPFLVIMGQKEALDNTVVIRDMETYAQEIISIENLPSHLKKRVKKV